ncbi:hypothetical protein LEN26_013499 [Aphanomyces euteiches]|nr:hypothetical protein LEN26_013499 [Aphanomyces euteiches]KAH9125278.1 hypothetical protein AeMF1_004073 [Aphanomyces euteiches]KAH9192754.1 hypothetical protein AeNC1_005274 [Aphanomyces euteiches]
MSVKSPLMYVDDSIKPSLGSPIPLLEKQPKKESRTIANLKNSLRSIGNKAVTLFDESPGYHSRDNSSRSTQSASSRSSSNVSQGVSPKVPTSSLAIVINTRRLQENDDDSDTENELASSDPNRVVFVRDFMPDPRKLLQGRGSSAFVRSLIRANVIDCASCKWSPAYFSYVSYGARRKQLTTLEANSLRWLICQYIIIEAARRNAVQQALREQLGRKLTDFRIAVQCVSGMTVLKYGRKGKPHTTQLQVEHADSIRWTPKLGHHLTSMLQQQKQKSIALSTVIAIESGIKSEVFRKAVKDSKSQLDPTCCLSLITPTRTLDVVTSSRQQCDWLRRGVELMVAQAHENEKKASAHVETTIMKKLGSMTVFKHGRRGKPHKTQLNVDKYGEITWKGKSGGAVLLPEVIEIRLGHGTAVFQRLPQKSNPKHCVSLVTVSRTLDLELVSESERDYVVIAFRYLLNKMRDRAREAKRMKAERGVRKLQEAYEYHARNMQLQNQTFDLERYPGAAPVASPSSSLSSSAPSSPVALERYPSQPRDSPDRLPSSSTSSTGSSQASSPATSSTMPR